MGKEFIRLLISKSSTLRESYGIEWKLTGVASRRIGWIADSNGLDPRALLDGRFPEIPAWKIPRNVREWLEAADPSVFFEATSLDRHEGQPATDHIKAALESGAHAISANKGPIVHSYREIRDLARRKNLKFLFESTVMDGVPIFSMARALPAAELRGFRGILNSTTNFVLTEMEKGRALEDAVKVAQQAGFAETNPSDDLDGWDAAVKVAALVIVLMDFPIRLDQVERTGIRGITPDQLRAARDAGKRCKLICSAERQPGGGVRASVRPEMIPLADPFALFEGTTAGLRFEYDMFGISVTEHEHEPGVLATAYGLLADFIRAVRDPI